MATIFRHIREQAHYMKHFHIIQNLKLEITLFDNTFISFPSYNRRVFQIEVTFRTFNTLRTRIEVDFLKIPSFLVRLGAPAKSLAFRDSSQADHAETRVERNS